MKTKKNDSERPSIETLKRGHRVTAERHAMFSKALDKQFGIDRPRMGRPPKGADKYVHMTMRIPPEVLAHVKTKALKQGIKYQTFITQVLRAA